MAEKSTQVVDFNDRFYWSLTQLSSAFGPARETIAKRLNMAGIRAAKQRGGHDVYHISDASQAILSGELPSWEDVKDPDKLPPKDRLDWYKSQNEKTKFQREAMELIPVSEVSQEMAKIVKICVRTIETLPDILDMKCRLSPEVISLVESECDAAREQLALELSE